MNFSIKNFFSKCDQIRSFLRIWSHLVKKSLMEKFIFWEVKLLALAIYIFFVKSMKNLWVSKQNMVESPSKLDCKSDIRSSCPEVFSKKGFIRNFAKFRGKRLCQSPFFNIFFKKKDSGTGISCEFCAIFKNTFFHRTPPAAASVICNLNFVEILSVFVDNALSRSSHQSCSVKKFVLKN